MTEFLYYSLKSAICLVCLYLPYQFYFRKTTFFQGNRIYLLGAILFSLVLPIQIFQIQIGSDAEKLHKLVHSIEDFQLESGKNSENKIVPPQKNKDQLNKIDEITEMPFIQESAPEERQTTTLFKNNWLSILYFSGFGIFLISLLFRLLGIFRLIKKNEKVNQKGFIEVKLNGNEKRVFSFFNYVFFNRTLFPTGTQETLIRHELVHIRQWHSVDLLILEILQVIFWFNPLFRLFRKSLQNEHEYFADQQSVINQSKRKYTHTLLELASKKRPLLGQAFAYIPITQRILKLSQKPSFSMEKSKYLASMPVLAVLCLCFSCSLNDLDDNIDVANGENLQVKSVNVSIAFKPFQASHNFEIGTILFEESGKFNVEETSLKIFNPIIDNSKTQDKQIAPPVTRFLSLIKGKWSLLKHNRTLENTTGLSGDFYAKSIQWLVSYEWLIDQEVFLYLNQPEVYALGKRKELVEENGFANRLNYVQANENYFKVDRIEEGGKSTVETKIILNKQKQPETWTNTRFFQSNSTINTVENPSTTNRKINNFEIEYNAYGLPSSITHIHTEEWEANLDYVAPVTQSKTLLKMDYNASNQLETLEYFDNNGSLLQKYMLSYDDKGYCTKKSYFDKNGELDFALLFDYEFIQAID
ncbi:M56 family metallopeptidase [Flexithrix dorotheae]|uniref:M56 family metallopeptidase n=1 Tax=Flexithrix dorotheae TaxID=70993 RepID=UPI0003781B81|nr:M56 family metallopeptidase [Flexithrix dorotheae]